MHFKGERFPPTELLCGSRVGFLVPTLIHWGPILWVAGIENPATPLCGTLTGENSAFKMNFI